MIERAEAVAAATRPMKKDRFVKITDAVKGVDWALVERARYLADFVDALRDQAVRLIAGLGRRVVGRGT